MYIRTLSQVPDGAVGEYQSKAAALQATEEQLKKYESDCRGIDILKHLRKAKLTTYDETLLLQRRINELPKLFEERAKLDGRARLWQDSPEKNRVFTDPVAERHRIEAFVQRTGPCLRRCIEQSWRNFSLSSAIRQIMCSGIWKPNCAERDVRPG